MGILRLLFAFSVVIFHASPVLGYNIVNNEIAVLSFFVISGFYMSLILDKKYIGKNGGYKLFITNRFLRIFPLYWTVLSIFLFLILLKFIFHIGTVDNAIQHYFQNADDIPKNEFLFALVNFILRNITLIISFDYFFGFPRTAGYLLIQQAWSLQVELLFYLLAPFLFRVKRVWFYLYFIFYCIVFFGVIDRYHILSVLFLSYIFFSYLFYFFLGGLSYHLFTYIKKDDISKYTLLGIFFSFLIYITFYGFIPHISIPFFNIPDILYFGILILVIPFIFLLTQKNMIDHFVGGLSYPVYINHILVIKLFDNLHFSRSYIFSFFVIVVSSLCGYLLVKIIEDPIDRIRQKRIKK